MRRGRRSRRAVAERSFEVSLDVIQLDSIPVTNAVMFVRWDVVRAHLATPHTGRTASVAVDSATNSVEWNQSFSFVVRIPAEQTDTSILQPCLLRLLLRSEKRRRSGFDESGFIEIDLSETAVGSGRLSRSFLLNDSMLNSLLKVRVKITLRDGDMFFRSHSTTMATLPSSSPNGSSTNPMASSSTMSSRGLPMSSNPGIQYAIPPIPSAPTEAFALPAPALGTTPIPSSRSVPSLSMQVPAGDYPQTGFALDTSLPSTTTTSSPYDSLNVSPPGSAATPSSEPGYTTATTQKHATDLGGSPAALPQTSEAVLSFSTTATDGATLASKASLAHMPSNADSAAVDAALAAVDAFDPAVQQTSELAPPQYTAPVDAHGRTLQRLNGMHPASSHDSNAMDRYGSTASNVDFGQSLDGFGRALTSYTGSRTRSIVTVRHDAAAVLDNLVPEPAQPEVYEAIRMRRVREELPACVTQSRVDVDTAITELLEREGILTMEDGSRKILDFADSTLNLASLLHTTSSTRIPPTTQTIHAGNSHTDNDTTCAVEHTHGGTLSTQGSVQENPLDRGDSVRVA